MGTDIHGVFQRHNTTTGQWEDIPSDYQQDRHYQLFAVLAGVRNGYAFAGLPSGEAVTPISAPRGFPEDFEFDPVQGDHDEVWMGDHTYSWLSATEMLDWYSTAPTVLQTGIFNRDCYELWDKVSPPEFGYCRGISGGGIIVVNDNKVEREKFPDWTHIRCEWEQSLKVELAYFFDEVARLQDEHGEVRFVFGFDS